MFKEVQLAVQPLKVLTFVFDFTVYLFYCKKTLALAILFLRFHK